jgi:hypothetical protein
LIEYALILACVALACLGTLLLVSGAISGFFGSSSNPPNHFRAPPAPGPTTPPLSLPTSVEQCLHGGWRNYPQFEDEASCVQFVTGAG